MSDRYDELAPPHLITTLKSLRRRWTAVSGPVRSDPDLFARIGEAGPTGESLGSIASLAAHQVSAIATACQRVIEHNDVRLPAETLAPMQPPGERAALEVATATIADHADRLADALDHLAADDWTRSALLDSGASVELVTLVRAAVRHGVEHLRAAEAQLEWLRKTAD